MFSLTAKPKGIRRPEDRLRWAGIVGDFMPVIQESPGVYKMYVPEITQTGANVVTYLRLPKRHSLMGIHFKHLDAARAENTAALAIRFDKELRPDNWDNFFTDAACTNYDVMLPFSEIEVESTFYRVQTNTTAGHLVVVTFKVRAAD